MALENSNRAMKVHLYCSLRLSVEKQQISLDLCTEGWQNCIGTHISDNNIEEESNTESFIHKEKSGK